MYDTRWSIWSFNSIQRMYITFTRVSIARCVVDAGVHALFSTSALWLSTLDHLHPSQQTSCSFALHMTNRYLTADQPKNLHVCICLYKECFSSCTRLCMYYRFSGNKDWIWVKTTWPWCGNLCGFVRRATHMHHLDFSCLLACTWCNPASWSVELHVAS